MFQRVLWVSLTQAIRSTALVLLPTSFISLLAWATAGSSNGNTTEPMRAALWMWLGAHHVPFHVIVPPAGLPGLFSYLPAGALVFPLLAIRSGLKRAFDGCDFNPRALRLIRILYATCYSGIATLLAWASTSRAVTPILYLVPLMSISLVFVASIGINSSRKTRDFSPIRLASYLLVIVMGFSSLALGASMFRHLKTIENLTVVLQPGLLGGLLLFILMALYIPNVVVATFAYAVGPGFAVGRDTLVSPLTHRVLEIPALPILGALPSSRHPFILFSALVVVAGGIVIYRVTMLHSVRALAHSYLYAVAGVALLSVLSCGSLFTRSLSAVGVSPWQVTAYVAVELLVGVLLGWLLPLLFGQLRNRVAR